MRKNVNFSFCLFLSVILCNSRAVHFICKIRLIVCVVCKNICPNPKRNKILEIAQEKNVHQAQRTIKKEIENLGKMSKNWN